MVKVLMHFYVADGVSEISAKVFEQLFRIRWNKKLHPKCI